MTRKEMFKRDFARIQRKIEKYNEKLAEYVRITGDDAVPDIECTVIGYSPLEPLKTRNIRHGISVHEGDAPWGIEIVVEKAEWSKEYWLSGEDELDDLIKYNYRRLRKGMRVWKSENPDAELEKDDD